MAIFNPGVPKPSDPNYLGYSHPISQPQGDQSMEALFKGIGNTLEAGIKSADFLVKHKISEDIRAEAEAERDAFTGQLEEMKAGFATRTAPASDDLSSNDGPLAYSAEEPSVFSANAQAVPEDLETLPDVLSQLHGARRSRVISQTDYMGRLAKLASEYRNQYPGYKDFIDAKFSQVTGVDPANAYVRSLISDVNYAANARSGTSDPILKEILAKNHIPGQPQMYEGYQRYLRGETGGTPPQQVLEWINNWEVTDAKLKRMENIRKAGEGNDKFQKENAEKELQLSTTGIANNWFSVANNKVGFTPEKIQQFIMDPNSKIDQKTARHYAQMVTNARNTAYQEAWKRATEGGEHSIVRKLGADKTRELINNNLVLFDNVIKSLMDEKIGHAYGAINAAKDMSDENKARLYSKPGLGEVLQLYDTVRQSGGDALVGQINTHVFANTTVLESLKEELKQATSRMLTQKEAPGANGVVPRTPVTIDSILKRAEAAGIQDAGFNEKVYNVVDFISNPTTPDELKLGAVQAAFDPSNAGIIARLERDGVDPISNKPTAGKYSIFKRMTSPEITAEVIRLDQKYPGTLDMYKSGAERMFGQELFQREIADLASIQVHPNMALTWDTKNKQWGLRIGEDPNALYKDLRKFQSIPNIDWARTKTAQKTIINLNRGLKNMAAMAKALGMEESGVEIFLMSSMQEGFNRILQSGGRINEGFINSLPSHMAHAIVAAKRAQEAAEKAKTEAAKKFETGE